MKESSAAAAAAYEDVDYASSTMSFPHKLFILLESGEYADLINWVEHGMCFRVHDAEKFAEEVVPKYFKQTKLTSFQRQLNLYGFRRLSKGEDQGCYFHPKFQRNRKDLLTEIKRLPAKGSLQSYEQVMAALHSRPAERFGSKRKLPTVKEETDPKKRMTGEQENSANGQRATFTAIPSSGLVSTSNPYYPKMSKLTLNIGYHKFLENQQKDSNNSTKIMPLRQEHFLRSYVQQQHHHPMTTTTALTSPSSSSSSTLSLVPPPPLPISYQEIPYDFALPFSSNFSGESFAAEELPSIKSFDDLSFMNVDEGEDELLDFLEPMREEMDEVEGEGGVIR